MRWFKRKYKLDTLETLSKKVYELESEMYRLNRLENELDCLKHSLTPLESKLIYTTGINDAERKEAKSQGFVLKGITRNRVYEIWVKTPTKDEIPKTC